MTLMSSCIYTTLRLFHNVHFPSSLLPSLFFFNDPTPTEIYTLSLHDALPIFAGDRPARRDARLHDRGARGVHPGPEDAASTAIIDRKSTRLNSSHVAISYAVFCLKKKKKCNDINQQYDK